MGEKNRETDIETHFKDTFRAFSKDNDGKPGKQQSDNCPGCIPASELMFVMKHLPGKVGGSCKELDISY